MQKHSIGKPRKKMGTESKMFDDDPRFLGLKLGTWSTGISLAFSIGAITITGYDKFIATPQPHMFPPNAVEIRCRTLDKKLDSEPDRCDPSKAMYIVASSLVWENRTHSSQSYIVLQSYAELTFFSDKSASNNPSKTLIFTAEQFGLGGEEEAVPLKITPEQFVAKRTYFYPRRLKDGENKYALPFEVFRQDVTDNKVSKIGLRFYSELAGGGTVETKCDYFIDGDLIKSIGDDKNLYVQRTCFVS